MSFNDAVVLFCVTVVASASVTIGVACLFIAYQGVRSYYKNTRAFDRRQSFKVIDGGETKKVDPSSKKG